MAVYHIDTYILLTQHGLYGSLAYAHRHKEGYTWHDKNELDDCLTLHSKNSGYYRDTKGNSGSR